MPGQNTTHNTHHAHNARHKEGMNDTCMAHTMVKTLLMHLGMGMGMGREGDGYAFTILFLISG